MLRRTIALVGALFLGVLTVGVAFVVGMRARSPRLLNAIRRFNRAVSNPIQMRSAGTQGAYASVIRHTGRRSGRPYATPVGVVAAEDGFVIVLVYGRNTDWLKNVLASGSATIVHEGRARRVDRPEMIPMEAAVSDLSAGDQRSQRMLGIDQCLRVRRVEPSPATWSAG
jgi:deazaflavin-dependent oxidoreductase (nitroreductase family)